MLPLKCVQIPYFLQIFLKLSPGHWVYGITVSNAGFFLGGPSFCTSAGAVGALCWAGFLVAVAVTIILSVGVNILTLNLLYATPGVFPLDQNVT